MTARSRVAGIAVIALANGIALGAAAWNRAGEPESELTLSERELRIVGGGARSENSGVTMHIDWCVADTGRVIDVAEPNVYDWNCYDRSPSWLTIERLQALGFDMSVGVRDPRAGRHYSRQLARATYLVLELNGTWNERAVENARLALARREAGLAAAGDSAVTPRELADLRRRVDELQRATRLYVIDVGADRAALRARYPDRSRFAIVRGTVKPVLRQFRARGGDTARIAGDIRGFVGQDVNVPARYQSQVLAALPRYALPERSLASRRPIAVSIAFGKRLEPWITSVK